MESRPSANGPDLNHGDAIPLAPDPFSRAGDALARLMQEAARAAADRRPAMDSSDFSAKPRMTAPTIDLSARPYEDDPDAGELRADAFNRAEPASAGRRAKRVLLRFVAAVAIGVVATLAWQSYGETAKQTIAAYAPALAWLASPDTTPSVLANAPPAQAAAPASNAAQPPAQPTALASSDPADVKEMARELAALRQSVQQLAAGQEQMARTIAKLQATEDELRAKLATAPPPARKPVAKPPQPTPQALVAPGPRPLSQSFVPSAGPPPPQPRPPAGMP